MSTSAYILAIGSFDNDIKDCLAYPDSHYGGGVSDLGIVHACLFSAPTDSCAELLSSLFNKETCCIEDIQVFPEVFLSNFDNLNVCDKKLFEDNFEVEDINKFKRLGEKSFKFYYLVSY